MTALALSTGASNDGLAHQLSRTIKCALALFRYVTPDHGGPTSGTPSVAPLTVGEIRQVAHAWEASNDSVDNRADLTRAGQLSAAGRRTRPSCATVRLAVEVERAGLEVVETPTHEACAAAAALGWKPSFLKGDKVAACIRRRVSGEIVGVAICSRPTIPRMNDALTLELRCFAVATGEREAGLKLLHAIAAVSSERGYRRLMAIGSGDSAGHPALSGWERVRCLGRRESAGDRQLRALWACVLSGDGRIR
jgi:hypothetical protein